MNKRAALFSFLFSAIAALSFRAQSVPDELDRKYTPNESSPFNQLGGRQGYDDEINIKNAIKFCPTLLIRQKVGLFYERRIFRGLTLFFGAGKAFGADFLQNAYWLTYETVPDNESTLGPTTLLRQSTFYSGKMFLQPGLRIYFSGNAFDGGFFEFNYRAETMTYQLTPKIYGYRVEGEPLLDMKMSNFNFGFGITNIGGKRKHGVHEIFMLVGVKNFTHYRVELSDNSAYSGSNGSLIYRKTAVQERLRLIPAISIGYSFGFGF